MKKGFTLIELLVVISIIGLLTSVVLASVIEARVKGQNRAIKDNLETVRTQSLLYFDTYANYGTVSKLNAPCDSFAGLSPTETIFADPIVLAAIQAAERITGGPNSARCFTDPSPPAVPINWVVGMRLVGDNTYYYCIDSLGDTELIPLPAMTSNYHYCFEVINYVEP